jgi:tetrahydromethanopterin S-methyltransferase subunit B
MTKKYFQTDVPQRGATILITGLRINTSERFGLGIGTNSASMFALIIIVIITQVKTR